jgi:hypothetical protein
MIHDNANADMYNTPAALGRPVCGEGKVGTFGGAVGRVAVLSTSFPAVFFFDVDVMFRRIVVWLLRKVESGRERLSGRATGSGAVQTPVKPLQKPRDSAPLCFFFALLYRQGCYVMSTLFFYTVRLRCIYISTISAFNLSFHLSARVPLRRDHLGPRHHPPLCTYPIDSMHAACQLHHVLPSGPIISHLANHDALFRPVLVLFRREPLLH